MLAARPIARALPQFNPLYARIAAEPSVDEIASITSLLEKNYLQASLAQLARLIKAEHPLCLESDLVDLLHGFMTTRRQTRASRALQPVLPYPRTSSAYLSGNNQRPTYSREPEALLESKWAADEIERLMVYLRSNRGRKDWRVCATLVVTKSSSQCKAKYYNLRTHGSYRGAFIEGRSLIQRSPQW